MSSSRDVFFTLADEAAFTEFFLKKYPDAIFAANEHPSETDFRVFPSLDQADCYIVRAFIPPPGWKPKLERGGLHGMYMVTNRPELEIQFNRSSGGWTSKDLTSDGVPRWVTDGNYGIYYGSAPNKAQRTLRDRVWRIFPKIATWQLTMYDSKTRRQKTTVKTDKMVWAGHDAIRWARENPLRRFTGMNVIYGTLMEQKGEE